MALILPAFQVTQGQALTVKPHFTDGVDRSAQTFRVTVVENPSYPQSQRDRDAVESTDGWAVVFTADGPATGITVPRASTELLEPGAGRYVFDVWRVDQDGGEYPVTRPRWLDVAPSAFAG